MRRVLWAALAASTVATAHAQEPGRPDQTTVIDSVIVTGTERTTDQAVLSWANVPIGESVSYRALQRAMQSLYETGQFSNIRFHQASVDGRQVLRDRKSVV